MLIAFGNEHLEIGFDKNKKPKIGFDKIKIPKGETMINSNCACPKHLLKIQMKVKIGYSIFHS